MRNTQTPTQLPETHGQERPGKPMPAMGLDPRQ